MHPSKSAFVFAHYDTKGEVRSDIYSLLQKIKEITDTVIFVSTNLNAEAKNKLEQFCTVIVRENIGYDFFSYKIGIEALGDLSTFTEIVLLNSSFLALDPNKLLKEYREYPRDKNTIYGITKSEEHSTHLQSYFVVFPQKTIRSDCFTKWWSEMKPINDRLEVIKQYEIGMSSFFLSHGFLIDSIYKSTPESETVARSRFQKIYGDKTTSQDFLNPTHFNWDSLLEKIGIVKIELLTKNPHHLNLSTLYKNDIIPKELLKKHHMNIQNIVKRGKEYLEKPFIAPLLVFIAVFVYFRISLGVTPLRSWDEAIYAQVAREMFQSHDYLTPHWIGAIFYDKPPLYFWLTSLSYKLFGINEVSARLVPVLFSAGTAALLFAFIRRHFDLLSAFLSVAILMTTEFFYSLSRQGILDPILTFFFIAVVYVDNESRSRNYWLLIGSLFGFAILTKGAAAIIILIYLAASLIARQEVKDQFKKIGLWLGILASLIISLPWHVAMYMEHGESFIHSYISYHVIARASGVIEGHTGGLGFYLNTLSTAFQPWYLLLVPALGVLFFYHKKKATTSILLGSAAVFLFYTIFVESKLSQYVFPVLPLLAAIAGVYCGQVLLHKLNEEHEYIVIAAALLALLLAAGEHPGRRYILIFGGLFFLLLLIWQLGAKRLLLPSAVGILFFCALFFIYQSTQQIGDSNIASVIAFEQSYREQNTHLPTIITGIAPEPGEQFYSYDNKTRFLTVSSALKRISASNQPAFYLYPLVDSTTVEAACQVTLIKNIDVFQVSKVSCQ